MLREVATAPGYVVRPEQEWVDGRWCHVLSHPTGGDRLWLDVDRGCALLAREVDDPKNGALMQRYELRAHRETERGIWLPGLVRTIQYDTTATRDEARKRVVRDGEITFVETEVNKVDDQTFEYQPPPGALQLNPGKEPTQASPGGLDHLDNLASWIRRHSAPPSPEPKTWLGYFGIAPAILLILVCEMRRRWL
jgi:hypothetical protein